METWETYGHQNVKAILEKQLVIRVFPHAYLFWGQRGLGKKSLALEFARKILGSGNLARSADFQMLDEGGEEIVLGKIHEFISKNRLKPLNAGRKVSIINSCENLNQQSSNALLKTLEEPSESSVIILIANTRAVLPTLRSRCQTFNFNPFSSDSLKSHAEKNGLGFNEEAASLSFGSLSKYRQLSENTESLKAHRDNARIFEELKALAIGERILKVSVYAEKETVELEELFSDWLSWQRYKLAGNPKEYTGIQCLLLALNNLKTNKNKKLILQELLLSI